MSAIDRYLKNNRKYARRFRGGSSAVPTHRIAVVTCMDARLEMGALLGLAAGGAHVIRNAGGIVTDDVIRSLTVSQNALGTREIMLIQHTDCGMQAATDSDLRELIRRGTGVDPAFPLGVFENLEVSVIRSLEKLRRSELVPHTAEMRGFVFETETGRLREVR